MKKQSRIFTLKNITLVFLTFCVIFSLFMLFIAKFYLNSYKLLTERELVAIVECAVDAESNQPVLNIEFFPKTAQSRKQTFDFNADEWVIEGRIIKWKPLLGFFGVQSYYKLERLSSRYFDIEEERTLPHLVYDLAENLDTFWFFIYKYQKYFTCIEAVYGSSAFIQHVPETKYHVYMTSTGFMIKDVTVQKEKNWWFTG